jgi:putative oxidoreductase
MHMQLLAFVFRALLGSLFVGHGTQKLFGWFGGHGLEGTAGFFETLGLRPGKRHATAAGLSEAGGGALLALGLGTPFAAAALIGTMATAIKTVHAPNGPWAGDGGWEYNAVIIAALGLLVEAGPGELSLDHRLGTEISGPAIALAALGAGLGGAALNLRSAEAAPAPAAA